MGGHLQVTYLIRQLAQLIALQLQVPQSSQLSQFWQELTKLVTMDG